MALSFRGGISLEGNKFTSGAKIEIQPAPAIVTIPLLQHLGEPLRALVSVGDRVKKGQKIALSDDGALPLHASVSGKILAIQKAVTTLGEMDAIVIENDFKEEICPSAKPFHKPIFQAEPEEICEHIKEKGIVGMGVKAYPTWQKIEQARGKVQRVLINCAESEPYLTSDHRILLDKTAEVVGGVKILLRALQCERAIFAIENNKEDAIDAVQRATGGSENFGIAVFQNKYPQGDEKQLLRAITGKEIPQGCTAVDMGAVTFNAETCWAIYRAFVTGLPSIDRVITVSGESIKRPANLLVPLGISVNEVIQRCGGFSKAPDLLLSGGPMMGDVISDGAVPVTKCVSAILALNCQEHKETSCIRCGRCVRACPMRLMPHKLYRAAEKKNKKRALSLSIEACTECGLCTYICPSRIDLLGHIRRGKEEFFSSADSEGKD